MWGGRNSLARTAETPASIDATAESTSEPFTAASAAPRRLYRSLLDKKLFGVCGGIASYFNIDSTIVRILFVVGVFVSSGFFIIVYILLAIVIPKEIPSYKIS
ncbi:MAG: PspC domain-containing protein [Ignavibacteriae bacterium]|nr:PspC domain-containing protein [Ignavibacteriota bacterium]